MNIFIQTPGLKSKEGLTIHVIDYNEIKVMVKLETFNMPGVVIVNHLPNNLNFNLKLPKRYVTKDIKRWLILLAIILQDSFLNRIDEESKAKVEVLFGITQISLKTKTFSNILTIEW